MYTHDDFAAESTDICLYFKQGHAIGALVVDKIAKDQDSERVLVGEGGGVGRNVFGIWSLLYLPQKRAHRTADTLHYM